MELLRGALRTYAWGSRTAIAEFTGRPVPAAHPEAELWFGAHPGGPAWLETENGETSLPVALAADPEGQLGPASRARFGDVLPFLVKVLAADEPLSLQAHPSAEQAVEGYLREERLGIPVSSPLRNYRDTQSQARAVGGAAADSRRWPVSVTPPAPSNYCARLRSPTSTRSSNCSATSPTPTACARCSLPGSPRPSPTSTYWFRPCWMVPSSTSALAQRNSQAEAKTVLELGERYPGDAGVLAALLLNRISLAPGEAIFLPAGNLHTYLRGFAVEVMANSDNVLRGGLTPKHVDVPELLRVLDFTPTPESQLRSPTRREGFTLVYCTPADEFAVELLTLDGDYLGHEVDASASHGVVQGPQILLCTEGATTVHGKSTSLTLKRGMAAWVAADDGPIRLVAQEPAQLFRATVGL